MGGVPGEKLPGQYLGGWGDLGMIPSLEPIISVWLATAIHVWAQQSRLLVVHSSLTSLLFQGSPQQKGIVTYSLSSNRQRPLAGILNAAVFNTWRRFRGQVLYFAPPLVLAYLVMDWATQRNEYLNSKPGRLASADKEE